MSLLIDKELASGALLETPLQLIDCAIFSISAVMEDSQYEFDPESWHDQLPIKLAGHECTRPVVGIAGSMMAKILACPFLASRNPTYYEDWRIRCKLVIIEKWREGYVSRHYLEGLEWMPWRPALSLAFQKSNSNQMFQGNVHAWEDFRQHLEWEAIKLGLINV